ncbi:MAG: LLM class flavin-dependent oxidoreductase [Dehalococcoidia bacterium]
MRMTFGIHIGPQDATIQDLRRLWRFADESGFAWVSVWDHIYEAPPITGDSPTFEATSLMSAIAADTQKVRIGCLVHCMFYRNPAMLTKTLMTVEHLSGGRLEIGLGAGWHAPEFTAYGYRFPPVKERMDALEEGTRLVRQLLTDERTTFDGAFYHAENAALYPRPLQQRVPIWIGGQGEKRLLRIAARHTDGWNAPYISPEQYAHKSKVLDEWCEKEGRDPVTIARGVNLGFYMGATAAEGKRVKAKMEAQWGEAAATRGGGQLVGSPDEAVQRIGEYADAGLRRLNIAFRPPIDWDALQAFTEQVMPHYAA